MEKVVLKATVRTATGKKVGALRRAGKLPAVLYGHYVRPIPIELDAHETALKLARLPSSHLITLVVDGQEYPTLIRDRQRDPIKGDLLHLDFQALAMDEKTHVKVAVEFTGTAPAVELYEAVLVHGLTELELRCLPSDIPDRVLVDLSVLKEPGDCIHVRDLTPPPGVELLDDPEEVIVSVAGGRMEEEAAPEEEAGEAAKSGSGGPG